MNNQFLPINCVKKFLSGASYKAKVSSVHVHLMEIMHAWKIGNISVTLSRGSRQQNCGIDFLVCETYVL